MCRSPTLVTAGVLLSQLRALAVIQLILRWMRAQGQNKNWQIAVFTALLRGGLEII